MPNLRHPTERLTYVCEDCHVYHTDAQYKLDVYCQKCGIGKLVACSPLTVAFDTRWYMPYIPWAGIRRWCWRLFAAACGVGIAFLGRSCVTEIQNDRAAWRAEVAAHGDEFRLTHKKCVNCRKWIDVWCPKGAIIGWWKDWNGEPKILRESDGTCKCPECGVPLIVRK